jgi:hypothetical protein
VCIRQYVPNSEKDTILCTSDYGKNSSKKHYTLKELIRRYIQIKRTNYAVESFRSMKQVIRVKLNPKKEKSKPTQLPYIVLHPGDSLSNWYWPDVNGEGCKKRLVQIALAETSAFKPDENLPQNLAWSGPFCVDGLGEYSLYVKDPKRHVYPHLVHIDVSKVLFIFSL